jgi:hypothetical protein
MGEMGVVCLITQRSQVQILPPLLGSAGQRPLPILEGAFFTSVLTDLLTRQVQSQSMLIR